MHAETLHSGPVRNQDAEPDRADWHPPYALGWRCRVSFHPPSDPGFAARPPPSADMALQSFYTNTLGILEVAKSIEFGGQASFAAEKPRAWKAGRDADAGRFVVQDNLSFLEIKGAGHSLGKDRKSSSSSLDDWSESVLEWVGV